MLPDESSADQASADQASADRQLADRLLAARRSLAARELAVDQRARLAVRLTAICDAMKAPGADTAHGERRLQKFLEELGRADGGGT